MLQAVRFSGLEDDIKKFPDGVYHKTGDGGGNLSVGQRQRIGLARAYIRNTPIVIFDEPTSSIGQDHKQWFIGQVDQYKENRLVIIISHDTEVELICDNSFLVTTQGSLINKPKNEPRI